MSPIPTQRVKVSREQHDARVVAVAEASPLVHLRAFQGDRCGRCSKDLAGAGRSARWLDGTAVSGLLCHGCSLRGDWNLDGVWVPPAAQADPLLRLRLKQGPYMTALKECVTPGELLALALEDWDSFPHVARVLWVIQGGACALRSIDNCDGRGERQIVLDHDHSTQEIRGLLCQSHNAEQGKRGRRSSAHHVKWEMYERNPPADRCAATRLLDYRVLTTWHRDIWNRAGRPDLPTVHRLYGRQAQAVSETQSLQTNVIQLRSRPGAVSS